MTGIQKNRVQIKHRLKSVFIWLSILSLLLIVFDFIIAALFLSDQNTDDLLFRTKHSFYHHGLKPNIDCTDTWFGTSYQLTTDNKGFKGALSDSNQLINKKKKILLMGDSFTEGIGVTYTETFAGLLSEHHEDKEILNAGVASYSPKLYFLKSKFLIEEKNEKFNKLIVFMDLSDPQDEIIYDNFHSSKNIIHHSRSDDFYAFMVNNSVIWNRFHRYNERREIKDSEANVAAHSLGYSELERFWSKRSEWPVDSISWNLWAKKGIELSRKYMLELNNLCKENYIQLTIVVYPWHQQIKRNELDSKQVHIWNEFTKSNNIGFINLFPDFMKEDYDTFYEKNYIPGDVHWNKEGHQYMANLLIKHNVVH